MKVRIMMLLLACFVFSFVPVLAQEAVAPRPSPLAIASLRYKDAYLKITYSQPHKKGREVFGKLVPYEKVWRTGANEATELFITKNITINGSLLKAGAYSIFTIPEKNEWTIIINSELGLWGAYNYNPSLDVLRFKVPVREVPNGGTYEAFTIELVPRNELADLLMLWDKTQIIIPIKFIN